MNPEKRLFWGKKNADSFQTRHTKQTNKEKKAKKKKETISWFNYHLKNKELFIFMVYKSVRIFTVSNQVKMHFTCSLNSVSFCLVCAPQCGKLKTISEIDFKLIRKIYLWK